MDGDGGDDGGNNYTYCYYLHCDKQILHNRLKL